MAIGLVGVAILGLVGVYISGLKLVAQGRDRTAATDLARQTVESIKDLPWDQLPPTTTRFAGGPRVGSFPPPPYPTPKLNNMEYRVVVEVVADDPHLRTITVRVRWGARHEVVLATLLSE